MENNDQIKKIDELLEEANKARYSDSELTIKLTEMAFSLSQEIKYELGSSLALLRCAHAQIRFGNYEEAMDKAFDSLNYFIKTELFDLQFEAYNIMAVILMELEDFEKSMDFFSEAEAAAIKIATGKKYYSFYTTDRAMGLLLNNISENYKFLMDYDEALRYCKKAYELDKKLDFFSSKGVILQSLGELYFLMNDLERADHFAKASLEYFRRFKYVFSEPDTHKLIAQILWRKKELAEAEYYFQLSIEKSRKISSPYIQIEILLTYYKFLQERKLNERALATLLNAFDLSINNNLIKKVPTISALLAHYYEKAGMYEEAAKYFKVHFEYEELNSTLAVKQRINSVNIKRKVNQIEIEKKEIEEKNRKLEIEADKLQSVVNKISIISELGQKITATLDIDTIVKLMYSSIKNFMDATFFGIGLLNKENGMINYFDYINEDKKLPVKSNSIDDEDSLSAKCIKSGQVIIINDMEKEYMKYIGSDKYNQVNEENNFKLNSLIFFPLFINNTAIGTMTIQSKRKDAFTPYHVEMAKSLSAYAAIAINNAVKSKELEKEVEKTKYAQVRLKELNTQLKKLAENDSLTGIPNRRKFDSYINDLWHTCLKQEACISLILFDIDFFKEYNDNYGHLEGDKCLIQVAKALKTISDKEYFASRYGGDEFLVILPDSSLEEAKEFSHRMKHKISEINIKNKYSKISDKITISIGISTIIPCSNMTISDLIKAADKALYKAKAEGRDKIVHDEHILQEA